MTQDQFNVSAAADKIVREIFSDRDDAISFFNSQLPAELQAILDLETLQVESGTFIDEQLKEYRTDILFSIQTKTGKFANIYLLFEHKSYNDSGIHLQLLSYLARIYKQQKEPVPVIPFVFFHGEDSWTQGNSFINYFKFTEEEKQLFARYIPVFEFDLFNLNETNVEILEFNLFMKAFLLIMQHIDRKDLEEHLSSIFQLSESIFFEQKILEKFRKLLLYMFSKGEISPVTVTNSLNRNIMFLEKEIMTTAERLIREGHIAGLEEGILKGKAEGVSEGEKKGKLEAARNMLSKGYPISDILEITGLTLDDLRNAGIVK